MQQSQPAARVYDALEQLIKGVLPADCKVFQANMPLQIMDSLQRETMRICTYLIYQDRIRINSSGITPVHEVMIEISCYGTLNDVDDMARALNELFIGHELVSLGWRFALYPSPQSGKRDIWEPRVRVKREWLQFKGIVIEPDESEHESN